MSGPKTAFNNQWGQASDDGASAVPADVAPVGVGDGIAPLVDRFGRPYVNVVGGAGGADPVALKPETPNATAANSTVINTGSSLGVTGVSAVAARLYALWCVNRANALVFFQVHDKAVSPVLGDFPAFAAPIPPQATFRHLYVSFGPLGLFLASGISIGVSNNSTTFDGTGVVGANQSWGVAFR